MGKSQRTKGAAYEREVAQTFNDILLLPEDVRVKRNIGQARDGGNDLNAGPLVIECKRRKTLTVVEDWLAQAERAVFSGGQIPCVVARQDQGESLIIMRLDQFLDLAGDTLREAIMHEEYVAAFDFDALDDDALADTE